MFFGYLVLLVFKYGGRDYELVVFVLELKFDFGGAVTGHNILIWPFTSCRTGIAFGSIWAHVAKTVVFPFLI